MIDTPPTPRRLTLREAADAVRVSPDCMRRWIKIGIVPAIRVGPGGRYRIDADELARAVERRP